MLGLAQLGHDIYFIGNASIARRATKPSRTQQPPIQPIVCDSPVKCCSYIWEYQRYIHGWRAEFGVAKHGYEASQIGWFSDRSVCYLASGRPVIAQDTGFSRFLPTGEGLSAFETAEDVLAAIDAMNDDYPRHCRAARRIAEDHFDSDRVLNRLLQQIGAI